VDDWTLIEERRGAQVWRHSSVSEIIIFMGLEEHVHVTCISSTEVGCGGNMHIAWWYNSEGVGIH
jgi:hypothetical protein